MSYHRIDIPLSSPAPGVALSITAHRFGRIEDGRSVYLQAGLHGDEHPGLLVLQHLLRSLHKLDQLGKIRGCVTVVPYANPIGMSQRFLGPVVGRFDFENGENFNRNFPLLQSVVLDHLDANEPARLTAARWKQRFWEALGDGTNLSPAAAMKHALAKLSIEHDVVLDLHCATYAIAHIYASEQQRNRAISLGHFMDVPIVMLEPAEAGGGAFDQTYSSAWGTLQSAGIFSEEESGFSATVELRGQADVNDELASEDAARLLAYAQSEGVLALPNDLAAVELGAVPEALPLTGAAHVRCPCAGIIVYRRAPGERVQKGETFAEIVPLDQDVAASRVPVVSPIDGMMVVRQWQRLVRPGQRAALIAGAEPLADRNPKRLLPDF